MGLIYRHNLCAPQAYWFAPQAERAALCNGCGAKNFGWLFPDTLWGLDVSQCCDIHDWMYHHGKTIEDKAQADRILLNNLLRRIEENRSPLDQVLAPLRRRRGLKIYESVHYFGGPAFWQSKQGKL